MTDVIISLSREGKVNPSVQRRLCFVSPSSDGDEKCFRWRKEVSCFNRPNFTRAVGKIINTLQRFTSLERTPQSGS